MILFGVEQMVLFFILFCLTLYIYILFVYNILFLYIIYFYILFVYNIKSFLQMEDIEQKFNTELQKDSVIIACRFPLPNTNPIATIGEGVDTVWLYKR